MYGLQLSTQLSVTDILKLEPKAAGETWKYHLTKLKALVCVLGRQEAKWMKIFKKEFILCSLPRLTRYSI